MARTAKVKQPAERGEVTYKNRKGDVMFEMASVDNRDTFVLYEVSGGKRKKLGEGDDPKILEGKHKILAKIRE